MLEQILKQILINLDAISPSLLLLLLTLFRNRITKGRNPVLYFALIQFIANTICNLFDKFNLNGNNNILIYDINCILSIFTLSYYFRNVLSFKHKQTILTFTFILFVIFVVTDLLYLETLERFNSYLFSVASFLITIYCLLYYYEQLSNPHPPPIKKSRNFWFITGLFTYYSSSFFIFATYNILTKNETQDVGILWQLHNVICFIMHIYLFIGFLCNPSPEPQS